MENPEKEEVVKTEIDAPKPTIKILLLGDYKSIKQVNFNKIPNDVITVGLDRSWILYKTDYYYTDSVFNLIELKTHKSNKINEFRIVGSDALLQSAKSSKRFNVLKDLLKLKNLTINNRTIPMNYIDDVSGAIDVFSNHIFKNYECTFYIAGLNLEYKGPGQTFIWEGTKVKPIKEFNVDTLHTYNTNIFNNIIGLKDSGYNIISIMNKSRLNSVIDHKKMFNDTVYRKEIRKEPIIPNENNVPTKIELISAPPKYPGQIISLDEFKTKTEGKRIALVANSKELFTMGLGSYIDEHDIVVRFNSFMIDEYNTGSKLDMHANIYLEPMYTNLPVKYRFIVSINKSNWERTVERVKRYKNSNIIDIHWPMKQGLNNNFKSAIPTTGLNTLFLFLMCKNYEELNMIGFNFYKDGPNSVGRHPSTGKYMSSVHQYDYERDWVMNHAQEYDDKIIKF